MQMQLVRLAAHPLAATRMRLQATFHLHGPTRHRAQYVAAGSMGVWLIRHRTPAMNAASCMQERRSQVVPGSARERAATVPGRRAAAPAAR